MSGSGPSSSENATKHTLHVSAGQSRAFKLDVSKPDTYYALPDGTLRKLGRPALQKPSTAGFQKFNPAKVDALTGARKAKKPATQRAAGLPTRIPFAHLLLSAVVLHRAIVFIARRLFGGRRGAAGRPGTGGRQGRGQHAVAPDDEEYDHFDFEEGSEDFDHYSYNGNEQEGLEQANLLPTMLRASLPKPKHTSLGKRASRQYHARPRDHRTAHQMLHPSGPNAARQRPAGKLQQMDMLMRQQARALILAQRQQAMSQAASSSDHQQTAAGQGGQAVALGHLQPPRFQALPPDLQARLLPKGARAAPVRCGQAAPSAPAMHAVQALQAEQQLQVGGGSPAGTSTSSSESAGSPDAVQSSGSAVRRVAGARRVVVNSKRRAANGAADAHEAPAAGAAAPAAPPPAGHADA